MNKYEQLIEHIINDDEAKARELFHTIVVEKSRDIYESLIDEQDLEEVGGNEVEGLAQDVQMDEQGISEEEEGSEFDAEEGEEDEDSFGGEEASDDMSDEEQTDRILDLESALDELKAEFDKLMAGEEHEEEAMPGIHGDAGHEGGEEGAPEEFYEAAEEDEEDDDEEEDEMDESIVREYVEKVGDTGQRSESGKMAASGAKTPATGGKQTKSTVAGKNDMGGSSKNIARGGSEANPDGTTPNSSVKPKGELIGKVNNTPGADAGKSAFKAKETAKAGEGQTTDGKVAVNSKSPLAK